MAELDWALANMDGQKGRKGVKPSSELVEADAKAVNSKEEVCSLGKVFYGQFTPSLLSSA